MDLAGWDARYRSGADGTEPTPLVIEIAHKLTPRRALDLACGTGRNAIWLAQQGWDVTAVDGAPAAIKHVRAQAPQIKTLIADLERHEYCIEPASWDLIAICYYLQRDLFAPAIRGLRPGGALIAIVHITEDGEEPTPHRLRPGELAGFFEGCRIMHYFEGKPLDEAHKRAVAEIVVRV
jgi:SAM-dependent methyltransferase